MILAATYFNCGQRVELALEVLQASAAFVFKARMGVLGPFFWGGSCEGAYTANLRTQTWLKVQFGISSASLVACALDSQPTQRLEVLGHRGS